MSGFSFRKSLTGAVEQPTQLSEIAKNSVVFQVGDLIRINTAGFIDLVATGEGIAGVIVGVTSKDGVPITPDVDTTDTYTMDSDNQTVATKKKKVAYIPALADFLFFNDADDDLGQTNLLQYFNTNDENDVDFATATDTATAQVRLIQLDPDGDEDLSKGLFQIIESQFAQVAIDGIA